MITSVSDVDPKSKKILFNSKPFPHLLIETFFDHSIESKILRWFKSTDDWKMIQTEFYEQYEFNLLDVMLSNNLKPLIDDSWINEIKNLFRQYFNISVFDLVDVTAHKHINGQSIGIHNDYTDGDETHRLVIQINSRWIEQNGGFQMLFNSNKADDVAKVIRPLSNSAIGFEISEQSHHAVSRVVNFNRFSLVYTFRAS